MMAQPQAVVWEGKGENKVFQSLSKQDSLFLIVLMQEARNREDPDMKSGLGSHLFYWRVVISATKMGNRGEGRSLKENMNSSYWT